MSSDRRQLNVRLDPESAARFDRLMNSIPKKLGATISQAQLVALALKALEDSHAKKR